MVIIIPIYATRNPITLASPPDTIGGVGNTVATAVTVKNLQAEPAAHMLAGILVAIAPGTSK